VGIQRLLHSSCSLNTNVAITRQLIRTAIALEAEWWQVCRVCRETWVLGHRKMSQVVGAFGSLDCTMLRSVLAWRAFWNLRTVYFFNFPFFFSGRGKPRLRGSTCNCLCLMLLGLTDVPYVFLNCCNGWKNFLSFDTRHWEFVEDLPLGTISNWICAAW